jgi:lactobin A/cerein 7B family class IIb bacteriocin
MRNLDSYGVTRMNAAEMTEIDGGVGPSVIAAIAIAPGLIFSKPAE